MMKLVAVLAVLAAVAYGKYVALPAPFADDCILDRGENQYDPANQFQVPWFEVNLDLPPHQRWRVIASTYKHEIVELVGALKSLIDPLLGDIFPFLDKLFGNFDDILPNPYREEIRGIAEESGLPLGEAVLYNIFYEIFTVCTSVVVQDPQGHVYAARNLDFGLFRGWNATAHDWVVSQVLRKMIFNVHWTKNGQIVYQSTGFAGFIGVLTGMKKDMFSVTVNDRFMANGGIVGILQWLMGNSPSTRWSTWLTRETLETANSFEEAKEHLMNTDIMAPIYYTLGGSNPWEGTIITRSLNATDFTTSLDPTDPNGWYILQTNYDQTEEVLFLDDRRTPGHHCMRKLGQTNVGFQGIYNVLTSRTTLNKLTVMTVLMDTKNGIMETYLQACPGFCWPW